MNTIYHCDMFQPSKGHPQGVKIIPYFHYLMVHNLVTLLLELVLASSLILQSYGYCVTCYVLLTKLLCINNFCHTLYIVL